MFLYHCSSTLFGTKCDNPGRFVWDYVTQDICTGGCKLWTVRVGMNGSIEKLHIIVTYMYCHESSHTDQYNRFLSVMLCILLLAVENGEFLTSDLKGVRSTLS